MTAESPGGGGRFALVIGAGGEIARAVVERLLADDDNCQVFAVSRTCNRELVQRFGDRLQWFESDYSGTSISRVCESLTFLQGRLDRVVICNGILHGDGIRPEKRLEDLDQQAMTAVLTINTIVPLLWLQGLAGLIKGPRPCVVAVLSARIGSIADNARGGWYSYRASKAALNMLLKTAAIELARRAKGVKLIAFHPGTVDTPLSRPFQNSVPDGKLFTPDFVAGRLLQLMNEARPDGELSYLDWEGKTIPW